MTITRETLELAALAAGDCWNAVAGCATDIGDAARLGVKLRMEINVDHGQVAAIGRSMWRWERVCHDGTNPGAERAYCEAVTLCAAEIGRKMKESQA